MNKIKNHNSNLEAIILAGGLGTRLASKLNGTPKCLASINNKPFIDRILNQLESNNITNICFATGHLSNQIEEYILNKKHFNIKTRISKENEPLGTGGALKLAIKSSTKENFIVLNGDTFFDINLEEVITNKENSSVIVTAKLEKSCRYGIVKYGPQNRIISFVEKSEESHVDVNSGIYLFNKSILNYMPNDIFSLERETFPKMIQNKALYGVKQVGSFIDIGTPEDLELAKRIIP